MTILVVVFAVFGLVGLTSFTNGDVIAKRDWFGIILGVVLIPGSLVGIWRTLRLGTRIDHNGIRIRSQIDSRQQVISWSQVKAIECTEVDSRAGMIIYGPVVHLSDGGVLPITGLGSYSREDAENKTDRLRSGLGGEFARQPTDAQ
jgi:hypothetical protein